MEIDKRTLLGGWIIAASGLAATTPAHAQPQGGGYGQINRLTAKPGQREALAEVMRGCFDGNPECKGYVIGFDAKDPAAVWVAEFWDSEAGHTAAMARPKMQAAVTAARGHLAGFQNVVTLDGFRGTIGA